MKYAASVLLSIMLIVYILYHISGGFSEKLETQPASIYSKEEVLTVNATVMRNETVLYSPESGDISYTYDDGSKLSAGTAVADVYRSLGSEEQKKRIAEIDRMIRILQSSNLGSSELTTKVDSTDQQIWKYIYSFIDNSENGRVTEVSSLSEKLLIELNKRRIIVGGKDNYNKEIEALKAEKNRLFSQLSVASTTVTTDRAGFFYSSVDGYENIFSSQDISSMSYSEYMQKVSSKAENYSGTGKGFPIGKIVTEFDWYTACEVPASMLHNFETDKYYDVKFPYNGGTTVNMLLYRTVSGIGQDSAVLIFKTNMIPEGFRFLRNQTVQIVRSAYEGYRIPVSALHVVDGQRGVYILRGSEILFKKADPIFENDGYFIIKVKVQKQDNEKEDDEKVADVSEWLGLNDFVIVKGKDLHDGKIVN